MTARVQYNSAGVNQHGQEYAAHWSIDAWDPERLRWRPVAGAYDLMVAVRIWRWWQ